MSDAVNVITQLNLKLELNCIEVCAQSYVRPRNIHPNKVQ